MQRWVQRLLVSVGDWVGFLVTKREDFEVVLELVRGLDYLGFGLGFVVVVVLDLEKGLGSDSG